MDYQSADFKKLLDKLQQESWQLELIISGFAIYGLFQSIEPLEVEYLTAQKNSQILYLSLIGLASNGVQILMLTLLVHVVLRGLWIGVLGLRYVSGDIDYAGLGYSQKFTHFLERKVGSFDRYIARLENICSTLFPLAFLMVFYFISFFAVIGVFGFVGNSISEVEWIPEGTRKVIAIIFSISYFLSVLLILIDFLGAGVLKRTKWIAKIYFPIYKVFGIITLSFLYRPLVYNFLDQKKVKWLAIFILPAYLIFGLTLDLFGKVNSNYQVKDQETSDFYTSNNHYEDLLIEKTDMVQFVSIPSKVIEKPYMRVFIGFNDFIEDAIFERDSTLAPEKDKRGYSFKRGSDQLMGGAIAVRIDNTLERAQRNYLKVLGEIYKIHIDSISFDTEYLMTTNTRDRFGFETFLGIEHLKKGKHVLRLVGPNRRSNRGKDTLITIPFWYYPTSTVQGSTSTTDLDVTSTQ